MLIEIKFWLTLLAGAVGVKGLIVMKFALLRNFRRTPWHEMLLDVIPAFGCTAGPSSVVGAVKMSVVVEGAAVRPNPYPTYWDTCSEAHTGHCVT